MEIIVKAVILAGGLGTRLSEYTREIPKPMVKIGNAPILLHIMDLYASYGVTDFVVLAGYRGDVIKRFFSGLKDELDDFTISLSSGRKVYHGSRTREWNVTVVDTGLHTQTGGRLLRAQNFLSGQRFFMTYGDGLSSVNLDELLRKHEELRTTVTLTAVRPVARFGEVEIRDGKVASFEEKPQLNSGLINGGFFVCEPSVFEYLGGDSTVWEREPLEQLTREQKLGAYVHEGFWHCMDTKRDRDHLEDLIQQGSTPWERRD
ncbi:glucose-1-phosphate cytidylyltransferase [bacterium]|nr:glucose-1-phosphate cytidylyltransferase [bacterium]